jgi:hypothetical protein
MRELGGRAPAAAARGSPGRVAVARKNGAATVSNGKKLRYAVYLFIGMFFVQYFVTTGVLGVWLHKPGEPAPVQKKHANAHAQGGGDSEHVAGDDESWF